MKTKRRYSSDLTDEEWPILELLIPHAKPGGRPRTANMREVLNGIFYVLKTGCQWENLPKDLPPSGTVFYYFNRSRKEQVWPQMNVALRERVRLEAGQEASPSAGSMDSQSVKTTGKGAVGATTAVRR
jgi:putative transposase